MEFQNVTLKNDISVDRIYSIHYFEYASDFSFPGESHDFWEFLYVDKGEVGVVAGEHHLSLGRGEIIFHKPNEFHSVHANGRTAPNLVVISFECVSPYMGFFCNKILTIDETEHHLMSQIVKEASGSFVSPLNDPYNNTLIRRDGAPFGGEQLIKLHLENMLINMIRRRSLELKYALVWMLVLTALFVFDCAPALLNVVSGFLGIYAPVNMIFFLGFCFSLLIIFSLTVALSRLSNSVRTLDQMVALNEKRLQDLEQELKKEKAKHEEETDHHRM